MKEKYRNISRTYFIYIIVISNIFFCVQCFDRSENKNDDSKPYESNTVNTIKSYVLNKIDTLTIYDREYIMTNKPIFSHYTLADSYGQYIWSWDLPSEQILIVSYIGDIEEEFITNNLKININKK